MVNEQLARGRHLAPGDALALPGWDSRVLGIYSDYGNPPGQVMAAARRRWQAHFPRPPRLRFGAARCLRSGAEALNGACSTGSPAGRTDVTDQAAQKRARWRSSSGPSWSPAR